MTSNNYNTINLDKLRKYVLTHREDLNAFQAYVDRSRAVGRTIVINPNDPHWEENLEQQIQQATSGEAKSN